jgi:hypothetical protein
MKEFVIAGEVVKIDETKEYLDFYKEEGVSNLVSLDLVKLLDALASGEVALSDIKDQLDHLQRWVTEAPRKKMKRDMRKIGIVVLTTDELFEADGGEEIIEKLENTGKIAQQLLEILFDQE